MIHRIAPESEWDRRYKANLERGQPKPPKERKKPGPKKGQPMPKRKAMTMGAISMFMQGTKL